MKAIRKSRRRRTSQSRILYEITALEDVRALQNTIDRPSNLALWLWRSPDMCQIVHVAEINSWTVARKWFRRYAKQNYARFHAVMDNSPIGFHYRDDDDRTLEALEYVPL